MAAVVDGAPRCSGVRISAKRSSIQTEDRSPLSPIASCASTHRPGTFKPPFSRRPDSTAAQKSEGVLEAKPKVICSASRHRPMAPRSQKRTMSRWE